MENKKIALILIKAADMISVDLINEVKELGLTTVTTQFSPECTNAPLSLETDFFAGHALEKFAAIKLGLEFIKNHFSQPYTVVLVDIEGYHTSESVKLISDEASLFSDTLVLSRQSQKEKNFKDRFQSIVKHILYRKYTGIDVYGEANCLKGFSDRLISKFIDIRSNRADYDIDFLMKCKELNIPVKEIKTKTIKPIGDSKWVDVVDAIFKRHKTILKFCCSSFFSFLVDYSIYTFILLWGAEKINFINLTFANIAARIISSTVNFTINRRLVFKNNDSLKKSAVQYFSLALFILAGNSVVLNFLANILDINHYFAKIITEVFFFLFNWSIQNFLIFKTKK